MADRQDSLRRLEEVAELRGRTRRRVRSSGFPCIVFGLLTLLSAPVGLRWGGPGTSTYWLVAAPLGILTIALWSDRRERRSGVAGPVAPYAVTALCIVAAALAVGSLGSTALQVAGPPLVVSLGYIWLARIDHEPLLAAVAVGLAGMVVGVVVLRPPDAAVLLAVSYGVVFTATGLLLRAREVAK